MLDDFPIKNNSREEFVMYICFLHNKVNERIGKPIFDCKKAFEFWGGECGCQQAENQNINIANNTIANTNNTTNSTNKNPSNFTNIGDVSVNSDNKNKSNKQNDESKIIANNAELTVVGITVNQSKK